MAAKVVKKIIPALVAVVLTVLAVNFLLREAAKKKTAEFSGTVEATEVNIGPKVPGRVVYLPFKEGDTVKKGEVLLRLDDREAKAGLERAAASTPRAEGPYGRSSRSSTGRKTSPYSLRPTI